jgi:ABC-type lipoprotein export system ATPase subunit
MYRGFVFQTFNLLSSLTALENVEMPMILAGKLSASQRRARAIGESFISFLLQITPNQKRKE